MAKVVNAHIGQPGAFSYAPPRVLKVRGMATIQFTRNHIRIAGAAGQGRQDRSRRLWQRDAPRSGLGVGKLHAIRCDVFPFQCLDLAKSTPGQDQQPKRRDNIGRIAAIAFDI